MRTFARPWPLAVSAILVGCSDPPECGGEACRLYAPDGSVLQSDTGLAPDSEPQEDAGVAPRDAGGSEADAGSLPSPGLDLNDVAFLLPIHVPELLWPVGLDTLGRRFIEPEWATQTFPAFERNSGAVPPPEERLGHYAIVGVRVDHCFPGEAPGPACRRQIRLVAQPVEPVGEIAIAHDAAVHLLYGLDDVAWSQLQVGLQQLHTLANGRTRGLPLTVHPVLLAEGLDGPYGRRLLGLVRELARSEALTQIATMNGNGAAWTFTATDRIDGALRPHPIPRLMGEVVQRSTQPLIGFELQGYDPGPPAPEGDALAYFYRDDQFLSDPPAWVRGRFLEAQSLLDPLRSSPATHDCVSCHVANFTLDQAATRRPEVLGSIPPPFTRPNFDLSRTDANLHNPNSFRAFGWFDAEPAVGARVSAEAALVAEALSVGDGPR